MKNNVHQGHRARKRFGQNFLNDAFVIDSIVSAINPLVGENLIEIGPGLGALTRPVCSLIDKLQVIELDRDLADRLAIEPNLKDKLVITQADALKFDFNELTSNKKMRIFGNLPYNISTPLMFHLFEFHEQIQDMHFMLQKEVVNRLAAAPNSKSYGRLTVMTQYYCKVTPIVEVPPSAFTPAPKVDSAVVRLTPHEKLPFVATNLNWLNRICKAGFGQRRKTIRNSFKQLISASELEALNIDPNLRPENLSVEQFVLLANWLDKNFIEK